jgi:hypothetical protein
LNEYLYLEIDDNISQLMYEEYIKNEKLKQEDNDEEEKRVIIIDM